MRSEDIKRLGNLLQNAQSAIYDAQQLFERMRAEPLDPVSVTRTMSNHERRLERLERDSAAGSTGATMEQ